MELESGVGVGEKSQYQLSQMDKRTASARLSGIQHLCDMKIAEVGYMEDINISGFAK